MYKKNFATLTLQDKGNINKPSPKLVKYTYKIL